MMMGAAFSVVNRKELLGQDMHWLAASKTLSDMTEQ